MQIFVIKKCLRKDCPEEQYTCNKQRKILDLPDKVILRHTEGLASLNLLIKFLLQFCELSLLPHP